MFAEQSGTNLAKHGLVKVVTVVKAVGVELLHPCLEPRQQVDAFYDSCCEQLFEGKRQFCQPTFGALGIVHVAVLGELNVQLY